MAIQILGGKARGFTLQVPSASITRPTSVMLRRRLYDWRQSWDGRDFVDLCAGSGAMGLEALSRGARTVWLNEPNRQALKVLEQNVAKYREKVGLDDGQALHVSSRPFEAFLPQLALSEAATVYFDPPYERRELYEAFWALAPNLAAELWIESDNLKGLKLTQGRERLSAVVKEVLQGDHWVLVGRACRGPESGLN